jgi:dTDP-4-dehydrorhamnose 3,5-epimerase-like enzyme
MGKLMQVAGRAFLVAVDIRQGSPNLGRWAG